VTNSFEANSCIFFIKAIIKPKIYGKGAENHAKTTGYQKMARACRKVTQRQTAGIPGLAYT
jgi:hypothetical protein